MCEDLKSYVDKLLQDPSVDLMEMYEKTKNIKGIANDLVYTRESLIEYIVERIRMKEIGYAKTLEDLDENATAELFEFDYYAYHIGATPITCKYQLRDALLQDL